MRSDYIRMYVIAYVPVMPVYLTIEALVGYVMCLKRLVLNCQGREFSLNGLCALNVYILIFPDINECQDLSHNACYRPIHHCINTIGGYYCQCKAGVACSQAGSYISHEYILIIVEILKVYRVFSLTNCQRQF